MLPDGVSVDELVVVDFGTTWVKLWVDGSLMRLRMPVVSDGVLDPSPLEEAASIVKGRYVVVTGQRASVIGWDEDGGKSLIYTWRSGLGSDLLEKVSGEDVASLFVRPGSAAPRIARLMEHGYRYVAGVETYFTWLLTGEYVVDVAYAHTYGLYNPFGNEYVEPVIDLLGIDVDRLPHLVDSYEWFEASKGVVAMIPDQSAAFYGEDPSLHSMKLTLGSGAFADLYVGDELVGDPDRGVLPILISPSDGFMAEAYLSYWGSLLDEWLEAHGLGYEDLDDVVYAGAVEPYFEDRFGFGSFGRPLDKGVYGSESLAGLVYGLSASAAYLIRLLNETVGGDILPIYIGGGGANSDVFPSLIAKMLGAEVLVRDSQTLSTIHGAIAYVLRRAGLDASKYIESVRPVVKRFDGGDAPLSWMVDRFREFIGG